MIGGFAGVVFGAFQRFVSSGELHLLGIAGDRADHRHRRPRQPARRPRRRAALIVIPELLRSYSDYRMLLYGVALVLIILLRPNGLVDRRYNPAWLMRRLGWR